MRILIYIIGLFLIFFILRGCIFGNSEHTIDKYDAEFAVQHHVEKLLKSPATADFGYADIIQIDSVTFVVKNYVDSENGFGAMLRSYYSCMIEFGSTKENAEYEITGLEFSDNSSPY